MSWWPHEVQLPDRAEPEIRPTQAKGLQSGSGSGQQQQQPASPASLPGYLGRWVVCLVPAWFWFLVSSSGSCPPSPSYGKAGYSVLLYSCTPLVWSGLVWSGSVRACPLSLSPCAHCCCYCNCCYCYCLALSGPCCLFSLDQVPDSHTLASSGGQPRPHPSHHVRHTPFSLRPPDMPLALHLRSDA